MLSDQQPAPSAPAEQAVPPVAPTAEVVTPDPAISANVGDGSLAEHEAAVEQRDAQGRFKHRSSKQRASAEDVPRIAELTKNWRTTEERALKAEKELAELREQLKPKASAPQLRAVPKVETTAFQEPEPKLEDFADASDPYAAWMRAVNAYDRKKERFEEQQTRAKQDAETATTHNQEQMRTFFQERARDFGSRLDALVETQADARELFKNIEQIPISDVMHAALMLHPKGEQVLLQIARAKEQFEGRLEDLAFDTADKPVTQANVEAIQRRLSRWLQDVQVTGSSAPAPKHVFAPRPPSPVRTVAMKTADTPPSDDSSLADHEAFYGRK